ncbi:glycosyltransferase family 87 protein [Streptomyces sp. NPDC002896]|uniref:glycosyltransferase family 87 protein n=1 Tax=Streptomyces sp. NPDC002896 TaxID=3154438 RepID=UPI00332D9437
MNKDEGGMSGEPDERDSVPLCRARDWLLQPAGPLAGTLLVLLLVARAVYVAMVSAGGGMDNAFVVRAAASWLDGGAPYADRRFLYLPSAVIAAAPQAMLPTSVVRIVVPLLVVAALTAGWACALRIFDVAWRSRFAALGLLGIFLVWAPFEHLIHLGNWTVTAALALPLALLLADRGRWPAAGAVVGAAIALKPLLAPIVLLFVFARQWRALGWMVAVPAAASVCAGLMMPDPSGFLTRTLPFLLRGGDALMQPYDASAVAVLPRLGVPQTVAVVVGAAAAAAGVVCAWRRWRRGDPGPARLVETAVMLMLAAFLVSRPSYDHYLVVVVPLLLAGVLQPGAAARSPWFWVALVPQVQGITLPYLEGATRRAFKDFITLCALAATVGVHCARARPSRPPGYPETRQVSLCDRSF